MELRMVRLKIRAFAFMAGLLLSACGSVAQIEANESALAVTSQPSSMTMVSPVPAHTLTPTITSTPTITPTVTPADPLSVEYLKQQNYLGELVIEEELAPEETYNRYMVSYVF
jgi:hypothetical protein